jgi:hypothetical protein
MFEITRNHFNTIDNGETFDQIWISFESTGNHVINTLSTTINLIETKTKEVPIF